jgi:CRISPR-associated helicase Cas3/CRISPR-associated endonuclease Cas3-HD
MKAILAKSNGISLEQHSKNVNEIALYLFEKHSKDSVSSEFNKEVIKVASLFHDLGKAVSGFQDFLKRVINESKKTNVPTDEIEAKLDPKLFYLHNQTGAVFLSAHFNFEKLFEEANLCLKSKEQDLFIQLISNVIHWHHGVNKKAEGKAIYNSLTDEDKEAMKQIVISFYGEEYYLESNDFEIDLQKVTNFFPTSTNITSDKSKILKEYSTLIYLRSLLIKADRICSMYELEKSIDEIKSIIEEGNFSNGFISFENPKETENFNVERFNNQFEISKKAFERNVSLVKAPAGFGKTNIGLLWSSLNNKKTIWVCPRNSVATAVYHNIISELKNYENDLKIELFLTGENKERNNVGKPFSSDIIVTNIDSFLKPTIDNTSADLSYLMLDCNVVFDEFHELVQQTALFSLFESTMYVRNNFTSGKTILLSATPFLNSFAWDTISNQTYILNEGKHFIPIHNKKYKINVIEDLNVSLVDKKHSLLIFNTITDAQNAKIKNEELNLIHSQFLPLDKERKINSLMYEHGKGGKGTRSLVSSPIAQAALDISFKVLYDNVLSPETTLQRIGRCNRWGEDDNCEINFVLPIKNDKGNVDLKTGNAKTIERLYSHALNKKWCDKLVELNGAEVTLEELYEVYNKFQEENKTEINNLINNQFRLKSIERLVTIYPYKRFYKLDTKTKHFSINSNVLRSTDDDGCFFLVRYYKTKEWVKEPFMDNIYSYENIYDMFCERNSNNTLDIYSFKEFQKINMKEFKNNDNFEFSKVRDIERAAEDKDILMQNCRRSSKPLFVDTWQYNEEMGLMDKGVLNYLKHKDNIDKKQSIDNNL